MARDAGSKPSTSYVPPKLRRRLANIVTLCNLNGVPASRLGFRTSAWNESEARELNLRLLPHHARHCCAAVDHIEFARRSTAYVNDAAASPPAVRPPP